jgi:hypothetical protein
MAKGDGSGLHQVSSFGKYGGFGGIVFFSFITLYSRFGDLKPLAEKTNPEQSYKILMTFLILTFVLSVLGLGCWVYTSSIGKNHKDTRTAALFLLTTLLGGGSVWATRYQTHNNIARAFGHPESQGTQHASGEHPDTGQDTAKQHRKQREAEEREAKQPGVKHHNLDGSGLESAKSTNCEFTSGPLTGTTHDYAPQAPIPVGTPCTDGAGSIGVVIARSSASSSSASSASGSSGSGSWRVNISFPDLPPFMGRMVVEGHSFSASGIFLTTIPDESDECPALLKGTWERVSDHVAVFNMTVTDDPGSKPAFAKRCINLRQRTAGLHFTKNCTFKADESCHGEGLEIVPF